MGMTFFSVDVETTSTNPFDGQLLSVGIVPIDGETLEVMDGLYLRMQYDPMGAIDPSTQTWWEAQKRDIYEEAWGLGVDRLSPEAATKEIVDFVASYSDNLKDIVFCANPVSFDHPWILKLFAEAGVEVPFHHRTVCMRSMYFGIVGGTWGQPRESGDWNHSEKPHHAYHDAYAQALDFVKMYMMTHADKRPKVAVSAVSDVYD